jgi:hypothetical protein
MKISRLVALACLVTVAGCATPLPGQRSADKGWYSAWAMAHNARAAMPDMSGRTVRMILNPSISGTGVRVKIENTMGEAPVTFSAASIGIAGNGPAVREGTLTRLTFSGQWPYYWVTALDVQSLDATASIVLFADSITDSRCSTRDDKGLAQPDLAQRWGDILAARLAARAKSERHFHKAIAISSISGNRVLGRGNGPSAFERLERDVLDRAGVTHVVFFNCDNTHPSAAGYKAMGDFVNLDLFR